MNIKVLGPGCPNCEKLEKLVREALKEMGVEVSVEKVTDIEKIMDYKILMTPALVINEEVVLAGKLPAKNELSSIIIAAMQKEKLRHE